MGTSQNPGVYRAYLVVMSLICSIGLLGCSSPSMEDLAIATAQAWQEEQCRKDPTIPCPSRRTPGGIQTPDGSTAPR